jgi:hypothetical protein
VRLRIDRSGEIHRLQLVIGAAGYTPAEVSVLKEREASEMKAGEAAVRYERERNWH